MAGNVILAVIIGWALYYSGRKVYGIYSQAKSDKPMECSCSGCSGGCKSQSK